MGKSDAKAAAEIQHLSREGSSPPFTVAQWTCGEHRHLMDIPMDRSLWHGAGAAHRLGSDAALAPAAEHLHPPLYAGLEWWYQDVVMLVDALNKPGALCTAKPFTDSQ